MDLDEELKALLAEEETKVEVASHIVYVGRSKPVLNPGPDEATYYIVWECQQCFLDFLSEDLTFHMKEHDATSFETVKKKVQSDEL